MPLVTVHGFTGAPESWQPVAPGLHLAVLGHSPELAPRGGESWQGEVERLAERVPPGADLAGYSLGARLALGIALARPGRLASLTLVGGHVGLPSEAERHRRRAADRRWIELLEERGIDAFIDAWERLPMWSSQRAVPAAVRARQQAIRRGHDPRALAAAMRALGLAEMPWYAERLGELDLPVRLVVGELDAKFRRIAEDAAARLPSASLHVVPGCGHNVLLERPEVLAGLLP